MLFNAALSLFTRRELDLGRYHRVTLGCGGRVTTTSQRARTTQLVSLDCGTGFFPGFATGKAKVCDATSKDLNVPNNGLPIFVPGPAAKRLMSDNFTCFPKLGLSCGMKAICSNNVRVRRPLCVNNGVHTTCGVSLLNGRVTRLGRTLAASRILLGASGTCIRLIGTGRVGGITRGCRTLLARLSQGIGDTRRRNVGPRGSMLGIRIGLGSDRLSLHGTSGTLHLTSVGLYRCVKHPLAARVSVSSSFPRIRRR